MNQVQQILFMIFIISALLLFLVSPYKLPQITQFQTGVPEVKVISGDVPSVPITSSKETIREFGSIPPQVDNGELREEYDYPIILQSSTGMYRRVLPNTYRGIYPYYYPGITPVPTPQRYRFHQPYYHRLHTNYPYYDPVYDSPLEVRDYCLRYPGCHPCPNWSWMQSPYCPRTRRN
jgi:hypothetical protein